MNFADPIDPLARMAMDRHDGFFQIRIALGALRHGAVDEGVIR